MIPRLFLAVLLTVLGTAATTQGQEPSPSPSTPGGALPPLPPMPPGVSPETGTPPKPLDPFAMPEGPNLQPFLAQSVDRTALIETQCVAWKKGTVATFSKALGQLGDVTRRHSVMEGLGALPPDQRRALFQKQPQAVTADNCHRFLTAALDSLAQNDQAKVLGALAALEAKEQAGPQDDLSALRALAEPTTKHE